MLDIEKLIKYHDFPEEGTLSKIRLNVVKKSIKKSSEKQQSCCGCFRHVCKECEQTIDCWIEEADRRERKQMQNELSKGMNEDVCEKTALQSRILLINSVFVFSKM